MAANPQVGLGLEFPIDIQNSIDAYMKTGDDSVLRNLDFFKDANYHSGRGSTAMIRLLKKARTLSNLKVFCFDIPKAPKAVTDLSDRDTRMAANVLDFMKKNPHPSKLPQYFISFR